MLADLSLELIFLYCVGTWQCRQLHFEDIIDASPAFSRAEVVRPVHPTPKLLKMMLGLPPFFQFRQWNLLVHLMMNHWFIICRGRCILPFQATCEPQISVLLKDARPESCGSHGWPDMWMLERFYFKPLLQLIYIYDFFLLADACFINHMFGMDIYI
jgi:hypothetical protein